MGEREGDGRLVRARGWERWRDADKREERCWGQRERDGRVGSKGGEMREEENEAQRSQGWKRWREAAEGVGAVLWAEGKSGSRQRGLGA